MDRGEKLTDSLRVFLGLCVPIDDECKEDPLVGKEHTTSCRAHMEARHISVAALGIYLCGLAN